MIKINNQQIVEELQKDIEAKKIRIVSARIGIYDSTLQTFMDGSPNQRLSTVIQIADYAGFDVELSFTKKNGEGENKN